jgi:altronate dehydratase
MGRANILILLDARDNIAIALQELHIGEVITQGDFATPLEVRTVIPRGHKIALKNIEKNEPIIKYGERMGHAYRTIERGAHVHTHNVIGDRVSTEPESEGNGEK